MSRVPGQYLPGSLRTRICNALAQHGPMTARAIAHALNEPVKPVSRALYEAADRGRLHRTRVGAEVVYRIDEPPEERARVTLPAEPRRWCDV